MKKEAKSELQIILEALNKGRGGRHIFQYPLEVLEDGYRDTLKRRIETYIQIIKELPSGELANFLQMNSSNIQDIGNNLDTIISHYLSGNNFLAYQEFNSFMRTQRIHLENLSFTHKADESFYRIRISDKEITDKKEMFHIPFNMRHLVATQRYSVAGVPSLYLGNTLYVCWQELNKPDLNKIHMSQFINTRDLNILDFAITFETLHKESRPFDNNSKPYNEEKIKSFFILYPLILACSFKKKEEDAAFNIEYIIPNMILQWLIIEKGHFDGIRYFSTKMKHERHDSIGINIVLPPKENKDSLANNVCSTLKSTFKLTVPVSWAMINAMPDARPTYSNGSETVKEEDKVLLSFDELLYQKYKITKFYKIEQNLKHYFEPLLLDDYTRPNRGIDLNQLIKVDLNQLRN